MITQVQRCDARVSDGGEQCPHDAEWMAGPEMPPHPFAVPSRSVCLCETHRDAVLHDETIHIFRDNNPWGIEFMTMFDMSGDSHLFWTKDQLDAVGAVERDGDYIIPGDLPADLDQRNVPTYFKEWARDRDRIRAVEERKANTPKQTSLLEEAS